MKKGGKGERKRETEGNTGEFCVCLRFSVTVFKENVKKWANKFTSIAVDTLWRSVKP